MKSDFVYQLYRLGNHLYSKNMRMLSKLIRILIRLFFTADIPPKARIGIGTVFPHGAIGVIIHPDVKIGKNCRIGHSSTLGGRNGSPILPIIEDNVEIGCHAIILGNITIGHHAKIGAGAVVTKNVPPYSVVVGNPAVIIKQSQHE